MNTNFRLMSKNVDNGYTDLFPRTSVQGIIGNENILKYDTLIIKVAPVAKGTLIQEINIVTTEKQEQSAFFVTLKDDTNSINKLLSYQTINQIEIQHNKLIITRLYNWPQEEIEIELFFAEAGVKNAN